MTRKEILKHLRGNFVRNRRKLEDNEFDLNEIQLLISINNKTNEYIETVENHGAKVTLILLNQLLLEKIIAIIEDMDDETYEQYTG